MECIELDNKIKITDVHDLDLAQTLDCGQSFRWKPQDDGSFHGVAYGKSVTVSLDKTDMYIENATADDFKNIWYSYFDFSLDERLCENFGTRLDDGEFAFPTAETLAKLSPDDLAPLRAGFRNRYIVDAAQKVANGEVNLDSCFTLDYEDARAELMKITGVGKKVADCTLLFGMHRIEAFPIDVWMKRAMEKLFPNMNGDDFGQYAGIAQQYIFHYSRMHPELF